MDYYVTGIVCIHIISYHTISIITVKSIAHIHTYTQNPTAASPPCLHSFAYYNSHTEAKKHTSTKGVVCSRKCEKKAKKATKAVKHTQSHTRTSISTDNDHHHDNDILCSSCATVITNPDPLQCGNFIHMRTQTSLSLIYATESDPDYCLLY